MILYRILCHQHILKQLLRDPKVSKICNVTEGLIEASLEQQSYLEVQVGAIYQFVVLI